MAQAIAADFKQLERENVELKRQVKSSKDKAAQLEAKLVGAVPCQSMMDE